jgi:hypothetical protein
MIVSGGGAKKASRSSYSTVCLRQVQRTDTSPSIKRCMPNVERKGVQCMCSFVMTFGSENGMANEGVDYASSCVVWTEDDDQMDVWSDFEEQKNK